MIITDDDRKAATVEIAAGLAAFRGPGGEGAVSMANLARDACDLADAVLDELARRHPEPVKSAVKK